MELKKLMEHISIIPDYRQGREAEHKLSIYYFMLFVPSFLVQNAGKT